MFFYVWTNQMLVEALSETYRQYFKEHFQREATQSELFLFYQLCNPNGGWRWLRNSTKVLWWMRWVPATEPTSRLTILQKKRQFKTCTTSTCSLTEGRSAMRTKISKHLTKHHRKPRSLGGTSDSANISWVSNFQHQGWHAVASNHTAPTIAHLLNEKFLDPEYKFICVRSEDYKTLMKVMHQMRLTWTAMVALNLPNFPCLNFGTTSGGIGGKRTGENQWNRNGTANGYVWNGISTIGGLNSSERWDDITGLCESIRPFLIKNYLSFPL